MNTPSSIWGAQPPRPSAIYPFQGAWPYHLKIASDGSGMVTTSPLLRSQQQNVINLLWPNGLKGPSLSLLLLVSSIYVMCLSWCSARNARCGGYCILLESSHQQPGSNLQPCWRAWHLLVVPVFLTWSFLLIWAMYVSEIFSAMTKLRSYTIQWIMTQYASTVLPKTIFKQRKATILSTENVTRKNVYQNEFKCFILMFNIILRAYCIASSTLFFCSVDSYCCYPIGVCSCSRETNDIHA